MRLHLVEPGFDAGHRIGTKAEHAHPRVVGRPLVGDDPRLEKYPQVAAHRRAGHPGRAGDLASPPGALAQQLNHLAPGRVGKCPEYLAHIGHHGSNN